MLWRCVPQPIKMFFFVNMTLKSWYCTLRHGIQKVPRSRHYTSHAGHSVVVQCTGTLYIFFLESLVRYLSPGSSLSALATIGQLVKTQTLTGCGTTQTTDTKKAHVQPVAGALDACTHVIENKKRILGGERSVVPLGIVNYDQNIVVGSSAEHTCRGANPSLDFCVAKSDFKRSN